MNTLAINTMGDELEDSAAFCRSQGIGIEVTGNWPGGGDSVTPKPSEENL